MHEAVEELGRQRHDRSGLYDQLAGLLLSTASAPAGLRVARKPPDADEAHPAPFNRPRPS